MNENQFIVGCFASEDNALVMVERLQRIGVNAYVYDYAHGLTRVSAGSGNSEDSFTELRRKLASHGINGWVYHNN